MRGLLCNILASRKADLLRVSTLQATLPISPTLLRTVLLAAMFFTTCSGQDFNGADLLYLPQSSFTYSSAYTTNTINPVAFSDARLNSIIAWSPRADDSDPSIIVDLLRPYAVHGVRVKKCAGYACHVSARSMSIREFRLRFSLDLVSWESAPDRFCASCTSADPATLYLSSNSGPIVARYVKVDSFAFDSGGCISDCSRSLRLGFMVNLPSNVTSNNAACVSASSCFECMRKAPSASCNWVSSLQDNNGYGMCVGAKDGVGLKYPFYTPNQGCGSSSSSCVTVDSRCLTSRARTQCSYDRALYMGISASVTCKNCIDRGCIFQSNFVSTSSSTSQGQTFGSCVNGVTESPSCSSYLYYYSPSGRCQPRTNLRIPSCTPSAPTYTPALIVPGNDEQFYNPYPVAPVSPPAGGSAASSTSGKSTTDTAAEEESSPGWVVIPFTIVVINLACVMKYCKARSIENTAFIFILCILIGPLVWFLVVEEAKQVARHRQEEANANMSNPYVQPFNPFDLGRNIPSSMDPDVILPPPPNPYISDTPRFDPDSAWSPPPNPYTRVPE
jgi:hypothetical protein